MNIIAELNEHKCGVKHNGRAKETVIVDNPKVMKNNLDHKRIIETDLGVNSIYVKGQATPVRNCWHFMTDGNAVDAMFYDEEDFRRGMNRIAIVLKDHDIMILAFCLMDTHVHFIVHGAFNECNHFIHEYLRRTSMHIFKRHGERRKLEKVPVNHQYLKDDKYLKTAICYTIKNPPVAGLPFNYYDYPWSSGSLYFRQDGRWTTPSWMSSTDMIRASDLSVREKRSIFFSKDDVSMNLSIKDGLIFPGDYVDYKMVERVFKSHRAYNYFICSSRESDIDSLSGAVSFLTIPMQEMRQHKNELCSELFGEKSIRNLDIDQRIKLARALKSRYNSSLKQIVRLSGLVYEEVKNYI